MIGKLTILSTWGDSYYSPVESLLGVAASGTYLINTDNILKFKVQGTTDTQLEYKLNIHEDNSPEFTFLVDNSNAALVLLSEATPASSMLLLDVYEGAQNFIEMEGLSTTEIYFNVKDIVWANENHAKTATRILVCEGGFAVHQYIVNHNLDQIVDLADTGTTSTTTTSTSSTSTTSTSTTSTSTTSTSTSSTSTTSTSTTSTTSTSTTSTSTTSTTSTSTTSTSTTSTSTTSIA